MTIVIISQIMSSFLFRFVWMMAEHPKLNRDIKAYSMLIQTSVQDYYKSKPKTNIDDVLKIFAEAGKAELWITDSSGTITGKSGGKKLPEFPAEMNRDDDNSITHRGIESRVYLNIPVALSKGTGSVYVILDRPPREPDGRLFWGLSLITVFVALILFPLSRKITNPLNKLTKSAEAISRGDFDLKVDDKSADEIGELARAFNKMSDKVLQMIRGTKELSANVSHQIRSPLARISVAAEIMRNKISENDALGAEKALAVIERECAEIDALTGRIIDLVRTDIAHKSSDRKPVSITSLSKTIPLRYKDIMNKKNLNFSSSITLSDITVSGITHDIEELFNILLDNAVKYTPENGNISLELTERNSTAVLSMENSVTAPLSKTDVTEIFEPFNRKSSEKIQGFGMGLAIAKKISENHGWNISANCRDQIFRITVVINQSELSG